MLVSNRDLHPFVPALVQCIADPAQVPETVHKLASTTFVTTVEAPSLAIMSPILNRGLSERTPSVLRQTCVIIDNMCKLVEDPAHAEQFLPKLLPQIQRIIEVQADPELRQVANKAKRTLVGCSGGIEATGPEEDATVTAQRIKEEHETAAKYVKETCASFNIKNVDHQTIEYLAALTTALDDSRDYQPEDWALLTAYLGVFASAADSRKVTDKLASIYKEIDSKRIIHKHEDVRLCSYSFGPDL
jgi:elongation factor 3